MMVVGNAPCVLSWSDSVSPGDSGGYGRVFKFVVVAVAAADLGEPLSFLSSGN